jgi:hypothetical protein
MPLSHDELGAISREVAFCGEAVGKDIRELPIVARKLLPLLGELRPTALDRLCA